jgi:hypothetical protein
MNAIATTLAVVLVVALAGAFGLGGYYAFDLVAGLFERLESDLARSAVLVAALLLLAALVVAIAIHRASVRSRAGRLSEEQGASYRLFVDLWGGLIEKPAAVGGRDAQALWKDIRALDLMLSLYGSVPVIRAHTVLRGQWQARGLLDEAAGDEFVRAVVEMRRHLGTLPGSAAAEALRQLLLPASVGPSGGEARLRAPLAAQAE